MIEPHTHRDTCIIIYIQQQHTHVVDVDVVDVDVNFQYNGSQFLFNSTGIFSLARSLVLLSIRVFLFECSKLIAYNG